MGSKGSQTVNTNQTQTYSPDPQAYSAISGALQQAQNVAQTPFNTPAAPVAGFSPQQQQAFDLTGQTVGYAQPYINQAQQDFSPQGIQQYLNPYVANVTANLQDIFGQQMGEVTRNLTQAAGGQGADRIAVGQSELAKQQGLAAGQTYANLYGQAAQQAQTAGFGEANLGIAGQNAQLQQAQALLGTGGLQQQLQQAQLNSPYQQQLARIAWPYQNAQFLAGITGSLAPGLGGTTTGTGQTTYPGQSPLASILGGGLLGYGAYNAYNNSKGSGGTQGKAGSARGGVIRNPFASGGDVGDEPIDVDSVSIIPQEQLTAIQPHIPQLNLSPPQQSGSGGKGSGIGDILGSVAKIAPLLAMAARGGVIRNPFASDESPRDRIARELAEAHDTFHHNMHALATGGRVRSYADGGMTFEDRAAPVEQAIASGQFDPQGSNYTAFAPPPAGGDSLGRDADMADALPETASPMMGASPPLVPGGDMGAGTGTGSTGGGSGGKGSLFSGPGGTALLAGLGILGAAGQRDARGLPLPPLAAIGQGGLAGIKEQQSIEQAAKKLQQAADFHADQYNKLTAGERLTAMKPVPVGQDQYGRTRYGQVDPQTGKITPVTMPGATEAASDQIGTDYLKSLPTAEQARVNAVLEGRVPMPSPSSRNIRQQQLYDEVLQSDPTYQGTRYTVRQDFDKGRVSQGINGLRAALGHADHLSDIFQQLDNSQWPAGNTLRNVLLTQGGDPRVKDASQTIGLMAEEATRAYRAAGGNEADIQRFISDLSAAASPAQANRLLHSFVHNLGDIKGEAYEGQWQDAYGPGKTFGVVRDRERQIINKLADRDVSGAPAVGTVKRGYRFKGGNPALQQNWEPAQ